MNADIEDGLRDRCVDDPLWAADEIERLRSANGRTLARLHAEIERLEEDARASDKSSTALMITLTITSGLRWATLLIEEEVGHE